MDALQLMHQKNLACVVCFQLDVHHVFVFIMINLISSKIDHLEDAKLFYNAIQ